MSYAYDYIASVECLNNALKKTAKGKKRKNEVVEYLIQSTYNINNLSKKLKDYEYKPKEYKTFTIYDPKKRTVDAPNFEDRVFQHSLCDNYLTPLLEKRLIHANCACRVSKGTGFARKLIKRYLIEQYKESKEVYVLKIDIRKYFDSIDKEILIKKLKKVIKEEDIMKVIESIINSFHKDSKKGLPLGNQTSQLFALYYMDSIDRLIKEKLRMKRYVRYMDDMIIVSDDKLKLKECLKEIKEELEKLGLEVNQKTQIINATSKGVRFVGYHYYINKETGHITSRIANVTKRRFKKKLKEIKNAYERYHNNIETRVIEKRKEIINMLKIEQEYKQNYNHNYNHNHNHNHNEEKKHKINPNHNYNYKEINITFSNKDYNYEKEVKLKINNMQYFYQTKFRGRLNRGKGIVDEKDFDYNYVWQVINSYKSYIKEGSGYFLLRDVLGNFILQ